jgi:hypothetical protein
MNLPSETKMISLIFKSEFFDQLDEGSKTRTIRKWRDDIISGDRMQLMTAEGEKIREVTCTRVRAVKIGHEGITLEGWRLFAGSSPAAWAVTWDVTRSDLVDTDRYERDFARADGFDSFNDMVEFFRNLYGLPFEGQLIEWKL